MNEHPPLPVSLYVHVPFCVSKCAYCDFHSESGAEVLHGPFVDAVAFEAGHWSHYGLLDDVPTLYVGGGTPTLLGDGLVRLVEDLKVTARLRADAEVTIEANPDSVSARLARALADAGVNRASLGVQSFDDAVLGSLGRCHDAAQADEAATALRAAGLRVSVDLICGVPGQSEASWRESLKRAASASTGHVSVYPLTVEQGTPLARAVDTGSVGLPDPDVAAEMMTIAQDVLGDEGLARYETANYARPGEEARHNLVYWSGAPYLGFGPSAASMLPADRFIEVATSEGWRCLPDEGAEASRVRFTRGADTMSFLKTPIGPPDATEYLTAEEASREDVMLGLRLSRGVPALEVDAARSTKVLRGLEREGLVEKATTGQGVFWRTTRRGWLLGNEVFGRVWAGE